MRKKIFFCEDILLTISESGDCDCEATKEKKKDKLCVHKIVCTNEQKRIKLPREILLEHPKGKISVCVCMCVCGFFFL